MHDENFQEANLHRGRCEGRSTSLCGACEVRAGDGNGPCPTFALGWCHRSQSTQRPRPLILGILCYNVQGQLLRLEMNTDKADSIISGYGNTLQPGARAFLSHISFGDLVGKHKDLPRHDKYPNLKDCTCHPKPKDDIPVLTGLSLQ